MKFVSDPPIAQKIDSMKRRVRWSSKRIPQQIQRTKLVIEDDRSSDGNFSFLVIGDSGCGSHLGHHPQGTISEMMSQHQEDSRFILHTGDVVYQVGSSEYYHKNFINPYRQYIAGGDYPQEVDYDGITFKLPFFLVPGNHDYYNLPFIYAFLAQATWLPRRLLRKQIDLDVGWHGSNCGDAYARAFLDYLAEINPNRLQQHLEKHYSAEQDGDRCMFYQPGSFTRLPNRYYTFRYGGIDFFALDSNTFNEPLAIPDTPEGAAKRQKLLARRDKLQQREQEIEAKIDRLNPDNPEENEQLDDCHAQLEQIEESQRDIEKQLNQQQQITDWEQLDWLRDCLIASWQNPEVRGRIIFFHHPPYVTEATKWHQGQTLAVRDRLRRVFDEVVAKVEIPEDRPVVDLALSGHAHCLEYLQTKDTGYGDSNMHWIVCGGSGHSLRRQRKQDKTLYQDADLNEGKPIGESRLYVGRNGKGSDKKRPYSFLRIDVREGNRPQFTVNPFVAERQHHHWNKYAIDPFEIS